MKEIMDCDQFADLCVRMLRDESCPPSFVKWAGQCMLRAYEDGDIDDDVAAAIEEEESRILQLIHVHDGIVSFSDSEVFKPPKEPNDR